MVTSTPHGQRLTVTCHSDRLLSQSRWARQESEVTYQQKSDATHAINTQMAALAAKVEGLAWKNIQDGCYTAERQARIDAMQAEYIALRDQRRAIWAA